MTFEKIRDQILSNIFNAFLGTKVNHLQNESLKVIYSNSLQWTGTLIAWSGCSKAGPV